jgi:Putative prokaryotic signal transducing protein
MGRANLMINLMQPENDSEANLIKSLLEENGIFAEVKSYHDTAYDGLYQAQYGWGVIRVAKKDFKRAKQIVEEWKKASPENFPWEERPVSETLSVTNQKREKNVMLNRAMNIILILSIAWNIFFLYSNSNQSKESIEMKSTDEFFDKAGNLVAIYKYSEKSDFPYEGTDYSTDGEALGKFIDKNENGRPEQFIEFYKNKKIIYFDKDENGLLESLTEYFENGSTIKAVDQDGNKVFEKFIVADKNNQIIATVFDNDQDSFNDEIHYISSNGEKEIIQISIYQSLLEKIQN